MVIICPIVTVSLPDGDLDDRCGDRRLLRAGLSRTLRTSRRRVIFLALTRLRSLKHRKRQQRQCQRHQDNPSRDT